MLGLIVEGDATLVAAMFLASQAGPEYFDVRWVLGIALAVTVGGNELLYELGALGQMRSLLARNRHRQRVSHWLHGTRSGFLALLFSRFMWGFRLIIPFGAGILHIRRRRFSITNFLGGVIWVTLLAYFGMALQSVLLLLHEDLMRYQSHIAVALFLLGMLAGIASVPWQLTRWGMKQPVAECCLDLKGAAPRAVATVAVRPLAATQAAAATPTPAAGRREVR
ncbi:MAG: DedA family protein [Streptosporangiaceae bacterium]